MYNKGVFEGTFIDGKIHGKGKFKSSKGCY